jgi:hypothetical protein
MQVSTAQPTSSARNALRAGIMLAACINLQGCFFFVIPIPRVTYRPPCVAEQVVAGERIRLTDGKTAQVTWVGGRSPECKDPAYPVVARLAP